MAAYSAEYNIQAEAIYSARNAETTYLGFTIQALTRAFAFVEPEGDWRGPIRATIADTERAVVQAAIVFFTATTPTVTPYTVGGHTRYQVASVGYRMGPAGDH